MLLLYRLLRRRKYRQSHTRRFDPANPPAPMRWKPKFKLYGLITGIIGGLGSVVLLAQYGIEPVSSRAFSIRGIVGGALSGFILPSAIFALVVWRFNRKLRRIGVHPRGPQRRARSVAPATALLFVAAVNVGVLFAIAGAAGAAVDGPCTAQLAGVDAEGRGTTSASAAIEVPEDGKVTYFMEAPEDLRTWRFWLEYGPYTQLIASGTEEPDNPNDLGLGLDKDDDFLAIDLDNLLNDTVVEGNRVKGAVEPSEFAWMGVGLYEVHGAVTTVSGTACSGTVLIDVQGNPLTSVLGATAAATAAVGLVGAAGVTLGGLRDGGELLAGLDDLDEELPDWRKEELAADEKFRRETLDPAEAAWEERKIGIDAERAAADAAMLEEIRAGRKAIEDAESYLERREAIVERLRAGEASQAELDEWDEWWRTVRDDAFDGMVRDVDSLPEFVQESGAATRQKLGEAWDTVTDPESWRVAAETIAETGYDAAGLATGAGFGDGAADIAESFNDAKELGGRLAEAAANDPWGFVKQMTPLQAMEDAIDPSKPLGDRLVAVGSATVDIGMTMAGASALGAAEAVDDVQDAARAARTVEHVDDAQDALQARRTAWAETRVQGQRNVDDLNRVLREGEDAKEAALRVQSNKRSLGEMKRQPDAVKSAFNKELRQIYDATDQHVLDKVRGELGIESLVRDPSLDSPNLRGFRDPKTGRVVELFEPTNAKPGVVNVGADRDFAVYVREPDGTRISIPHDKVGDWYADGFYEAFGGDDMARRLGLPADKKEILARLDQAVTSDLHPEAYRSVDVVINRPGATIGDVQQVGQTTAYKADHLFGRAEALRATDAAAAEDWMAEGARQLTKQWDNQVVPRYGAVAEQVDVLKARGALPDNFALKPPPPRVQQAVDIMREVQDHGLSPADMERKLRAIGMTPYDASREVGQYVETLQKLRPGPVAGLQDTLVGQT
jgi:hypothetical protein